MAEFEKDFLMRQVRLLARAVAGLVRRARSDGDYASGLEAIRPHLASPHEAVRAAAKWAVERLGA